MRNVYAPPCLRKPYSDESQTGRERGRGPRANSFTNNDHNRQTENSLEVTVNSFDGLWKESKRFHSKVFSLKKNEKFQ
ncbi:hypothetical protein RB195_007462 [Necator americanus]|uniref:Uncharacterized protein n=1 Tax=Necator americanus TaxID=51031 RepID=A0ABR1C154_NECAM